LGESKPKRHKQGNQTVQGYLCLMEDNISFNT
jgi:hypothetical protein